MDEKIKLQGLCSNDDCQGRFAVDFEEADNPIGCPFCGEEMHLVTVCPHCLHNMRCRGGSIGVAIKCPECRENFRCTTFKKTDGGSIILGEPNELGLPDLGFDIQMSKEDRDFLNAAHSPPSQRGGCLGSIVVFIGITTTLVCGAIYLL